MCLGRRSGPFDQVMRRDASSGAGDVIPSLVAIITLIIFPPPKEVMYRLLLGGPRRGFGFEKLSQPGVCRSVARGVGIVEFSN